MRNMCVIQEQSAKEWCLKILETAGLKEEYAQYVSDCLIHANLRGVDTHGLIRLIPYVGRLEHTTMEKVRIEADRETTCVVDAGFQLGPIGASIGMNQAIQKAREYGVGAVVVRNSNHCGTAAYYALKAAQAGMVGISMTNASRRIAPWGSVEAIIGNNPWSIALPGPDYPVVLDMANTVVANGKIRTCMREGKLLPEGWAMDKEGNPTCDPFAAQEGLLMPVGGYKGVGIAVMVDLLCALLSQGEFSKEVGRIDDIYHPTKACHFFVALDLARFLPVEKAKERLGEYIKIFKAVRLKEGVKEVFMPGEIEWRTEKERRQVGIPLSEKTVQELDRLAQKMGVASIRKF